MNTYNVRIPITGVVDVEVEAENEDEAIEAAMQKEVSTDDITEWETCRQIVQGNVFNGHTNEVDVSEV